MTAPETDIQYIRGVGEARAKCFRKLGVETLRDLVTFFPRTYEDRREIRPIAELCFGESAAVSAMVASPARLTRIRKGLDITKVRVVDDSGSLTVTFFNQSYVGNNLVVGETYVFFGRVGGRAGAPEMNNPAFERESAPPAATRCIYPVYPLTAGLSQTVVHRAMRQGLIECGSRLPDRLPRAVREAHKLAQTDFSFENIHFPKSPESLEIARRRLIFEEFFLLSCALETLRKSRTGKTAYVVPPPDRERFLKALPYALTGAQSRALDDIWRDMTGEVPMSRLLQGDVGSGKTVVAAAACWAAAEAGFQSAFMAPTEILAEQHFRSLSGLLSPLGVRAALLTGGQPAKERRETLAKLRTGEADLVIGTHALISEDVEFRNLALIVADEQHRFGVQQRAALTKKGRSPHVLVMSATPIPRTLALILYGDLDVSVLNELPPGRQKVDTFLVGESMRPRIQSFIRKQVEAGRQVFIVCPAVEESEDGDSGLKSVKEYAKTLSERVFPDLSVAMVHGKQRPKEKNDIMTRFSAGEIDILVATTVIEVGVDVPNATLMVVENADRFGLSQLHQLRGRVGRGKEKSYCVLFEGGGGETARQRLTAMCRTNDGFQIAEEDLRLRGPGDFLGSRQSGLPDLRLSSFASDVDLLKEAQEAAKAVMAADPALSAPENAVLLESVREMIRKNQGTIN